MTIPVIDGPWVRVDIKGLLFPADSEITWEAFGKSTCDYNGAKIKDYRSDK